MTVDQGGQAYACIGDRVIAFRDKKGQIQQSWEYKVGGIIPGSAVVGRDGNIRVHAGDGMFHCLTPDGDTVFPPLDIGEPLGWASPLVDVDGTNWVSRLEGGITKISASGTTERSAFFRSRQRFDSTGLIKDGILYIGAEDAYVYAIKLAGLKGTNTWDHANYRGKTDWFINSSPAYHPRDLIIVAARDEHLYAFETDGGVRWKIHIRGQMLGSPVVGDDGTVFVGVSLIERGHQPTGKVVAVDSDSKQVIWEYQTKGPIESTPVIGDDGIIYVGDNSGTIYALEHSGRLQWQKDVKVPIRSSGNIISPGRVVFGADDGTILCLLCSSKSTSKGGWGKYMG
ncbi:MAG: outer membrane protein assembly factor BamB [Pirellulaceae bacterium]